jgi:hypothetical protein
LNNTVSSSQSSSTCRTSRRFPDVSPFIHSFCRVRL